jgi:glycosyltransferase involved in cell wall biosynthesis
MLIVHALILAVVTALARLAYLAGPLTGNSDSVGSIRITEAQRGRRWLQFGVSHSVVPGTYAYPPLVYWLVSRLPRAVWTRARYAVNYLADTASTLLVWGAVQVLAPALPAEVALITALAYGLNPLFLPTVEHARISSPNARSLGLLLNTAWIFLLAACATRAPGSPAQLLSFVALVPLTWIIVLTSQFGMQTMIGLTTLVSLFTLDVRPVAVMFAGIACGWFVPGLGVREVLRHKFAHWRWYRTVQRTIVNGAGLRSRPFRMRAAAMLQLMRHPLRQGHALGTALQTSGWWKMLAGVVPMCAAIVVGASKGLLAAAWADPMGNIFAAMCIAAFVLFVLTTLPRFVFLGEAERYVEHVLPAFALFGVLATAGDASTAMTGATLALALTLTIGVAQLAHRQWPGIQQALRYPAEGFDEERAMLRLLVELGRPVRIASVPVKTTFLLHDLLLDEALPGSERIEFYFQHVLQNGDDTFRYLLDDTSDGYTYLKPDLSQLVAKYGITMLVVDSALLHDPSNSAPIIEALRLRQPMHRGRLNLYSLHDLQQHATTRDADAGALESIFPAPKSARQRAREAAAAAEATAGTGASQTGSTSAAGTSAAPAVRPTKSGPRILAIADEPNWIFERHARTLQILLAGSFDIHVQYRNDAVDESAFDLIYPLEFDLVRPEHIHMPWKYVTGIRSHISWDYCTAEQLTAYLDACFQRTHVVSKRLRALLAPTLPGVEYVTHGFDAARFTPVARQHTAGTLRLGWAGNRRSPAKGFEQFVAPLAELPGVELVHCGFADRNRTLDEMPAFYAGIDAYICTSATEGNNNSLLEAAATGAALITTRTGTVSEYLRDGESALIVQRQPAAFRQAVERLRDDVALRASLGSNAAAAVHPAWSWAQRAPEYRDFFQRALAGRKEAQQRMQRQREQRATAGLPAWPALPMNPRNFDVVATMTLVQQAVAEGNAAQAIIALEALALHDAGNPTWSMLLAELAPAAA